jgi:hypothetical protein
MKIDEHPTDQLDIGYDARHEGDFHEMNSADKRNHEFSRPIENHK